MPTAIESVSLSDYLSWIEIVSTTSILPFFIMGNNTKIKNLFQFI
jgi:hypothetical protein